MSRLTAIETQLILHAVFSFFGCEVSEAQLDGFGVGGEFWHVTVRASSGAS